MREMLEFGLLGQQPWWVPVLYVVIMGHISNLCVTLYLHRSATHEGVKFHPVVEHFMRFFLWATTSVKTKEWVACHRKHHAFSDREGDPHSPVQEGLAQVVFGGMLLYHEAVKDKDMLEKYGRGCPEDWIERNLYATRHWWGIVAILLIDVALFGALWGLFAWVCMAIWLPIFGNVINGVGHALGYRNFDTKDHSHNIIPLGIWIVGEELHNNHHADPRSANFRAKWYEFDIGWVYIKLLSWFKLANIVYARSMNARDFADKYYSRAAQAAVDVGDSWGARAANARIAASEMADGLSARAASARAAASEMADELSARAASAKAAASEMADGISQRAARAKDELSAAAENIAVPKRAPAE